MTVRVKVSSFFFFQRKEFGTSKEIFITNAASLEHLSTLALLHNEILH